MFSLMSGCHEQNSRAIPTARLMSVIGEPWFIWMFSFLPKANIGLASPLKHFRVNQQRCKASFIDTHAVHSERES